MAEVPTSASLRSACPASSASGSSDCRIFSEIPMRRIPPPPAVGGLPAPQDRRAPFFAPLPVELAAWILTRLVKLRAAAVAGVAGVDLRNGRSFPIKRGLIIEPIPVASIVDVEDDKFIPPRQRRVLQRGPLNPQPVFSLN